MALASVKVATFSRIKGWGYWQTVDYLTSVERKHGTRAMFFDLELAIAMENEIAEARKPKKPTRPRR